MIGTEYPFGGRGAGDERTALARAEHRGVLVVGRHHELHRVLVVTPDNDD
jgi:hypothetical protein